MFWFVLLELWTTVGGPIGDGHMVRHNTEHLNSFDIYPKNSKQIKINPKSYYRNDNS